MTSNNDVSFEDLKKVNEELLSENISVKTALKKKNQEIEELNQQNQKLLSTNRVLSEKQSEIDLSNFLHIQLEEDYYLSTSKYNSRVTIIDQNLDFIYYNIKRSKKIYIINKSEIKSLIQA